MCLISLRS